MRLSDSELDKYSTVTDDHSTFSNDRNDRLLPDGFEPSSYDVICGRGKGCAQWDGNRRFRVIIAINQEKYLKASKRNDKSDMLDSIVRTVRDLSPRAGFVRQDPATGRWYEIGDHQARRKVGHAMRDAISADEKQIKRPKKRTAKSREAIAEKASRTGRVSRMVSISSNEKTPEAPQASASVSKDFSTLLDELGVLLDSDEDNRTISPLFWETLDHPLCENASRTRRVSRMVSRMVSIPSDEETPEAPQASASVTEDFSTLLDELGVLLDSDEDNRTISPLFWETLEYPLCLFDTLT